MISDETRGCVINLESAMSTVVRMRDLAINFSLLFANTASVFSKRLFVGILTMECPKCLCQKRTA